MRIESSERTSLVKAKNKYTDNWKNQKAEYEGQVAKYREDASNYSSDMEKFISAFLSSELANLPNAKIQVLKSESRDEENMYFIKISYKSDKLKDEIKNRRRNFDFDIPSGEYRGFNWKYTIRLAGQTVESESGNEYVYVVDKNPFIDADILDASDYQELRYTYELFEKMETIDWSIILNKINSSVPKEDDYITTPHPGRYDTSKWDEKIKEYDFNRIIGKDIWIQVRVDREESYDRWSSLVPVDGIGWAKIISSTPKFFIFNWLEGKRDTYHSWEITRALDRNFKLKKAYFSALEPLEYITTEDLKNPET